MCFKNAIFKNVKKMHFKNVKKCEKKCMFKSNFEVLFSYVLLLVVIVLL